MDQVHFRGTLEAGLRRLPFRSRPSSISRKEIEPPRTPDALTLGPAKRFPETLHILSDLRLRSPTESSASSISSALTNSTSAASVCSLASPLSTSYAGSETDSGSRFHHRRKISSGTCSTLVNDEDDHLIIVPPPKLLHADLAVEPVADVIPPSMASIKEEDEPDYDAARVPEWDSSSDASDDDVASSDADRIADYTLQLVYGMDLSDTSISTATARAIVSKFVRELGHHVWQGQSTDADSNTIATSSSSSTPAQGDRGQRGGSKRKKLGKMDDEDNDLTDGEDSGCLPTKRPKPNPKDEDNLRLSCPYRKRNPHRFNVRDSHSCAMTYFPKFAELRQHIVKQHKREDPSAFVCDRCHRDFITRKEMRDHQRLPKEQMCDTSDHDPESGIDGPTANKLLSRKRPAGASTEDQWREIWNIVFPDDDDWAIKDFLYTPVIEHFELSNHFLAAFSTLQTSLRDKISNPATLETLATKFHHCFVETIDRCIAESQLMPYTNRSNKRNEPSARFQSTAMTIPAMPRKPREVRPRPDSGVVIDDGSTESGSRAGGNRDSGFSSDGVSFLPTVPQFDDAFVRQLSNTPLSMGMGTAMDPTLVQAWNQGVLDVQGMGMPQVQPQQNPGGFLTWPDGSFQPDLSGMAGGYASSFGQ